MTASASHSQARLRIKPPPPPMVHTIHTAFNAVEITSGKVEISQNVASGGFCYFYHWLRVFEKRDNFPTKLTASGKCHCPFSTTWHCGITPISSLTRPNSDGFPSCRTVTSVTCSHARRNFALSVLLDLDNAEATSAWAGRMQEPCHAHETSSPDALSSNMRNVTCLVSPKPCVALRIIDAIF